MMNATTWTVLEHYLQMCTPVDSARKGTIHISWSVASTVSSSLSPTANMQTCKVQFKGHTFNSSEQAYQWAKADFYQDDAAASNLLFTTSPRDAKVLGSGIKGLRDTDWDQKKNGIMEEILRNKFRDNKDLK